MTDIKEKFACPAVYLDYNATTPMDPRVLEAMTPWFCEHYGNAASTSHCIGNHAAAAVDASRASIAAAMGADPEEIVFTSGATESDNLAIKGAIDANAASGNHIVTCVTEHKAVLDTCKALEKRGCEVTYLPVDAEGLVSPEQVAAAITDKTVVVSIMAANNEIGTIHPVAEIGKICREAGVLFHCDATQAFGKIPMNVDAMNIDLMSISAHKIYGPKGIGALFVRRRQRRVKLAEQIHGGGHELRRRSGTLNVPGIVGLAKAIELAMESMDAEAVRQRALRDRLEERITSRVDLVKLNGHRDKRLPQTLNLSFGYVEGEFLMMKMPMVAVSSGSACTSATLGPSYVLEAIGADTMFVHGSLRFSLGRFTTEREIDFAADEVVRVVKIARELSPLYEMVMAGMDPHAITWQGDHDHDHGDDEHDH